MTTGAHKLEFEEESHPITQVFQVSHNMSIFVPHGYECRSWSQATTNPEKLDHIGMIEVVPYVDFSFESLRRATGRIETGKQADVRTFAIFLLTAGDDNGSRMTLMPTGSILWASAS